MKVYEAIPESIAIELWLNGDDLTGDIVIEFLPKTGKNPRNEKLKEWRRHCRNYWRGNLRAWYLHDEWGTEPLAIKYPNDKNYVNDITEGYNIKIKNYGTKALKPRR